MNYPRHVFKHFLRSPVNGHECRRLTKQNIVDFGFISIEELRQIYPDFPTACLDLQKIYCKARQKANINSAIVHTGSGKPKETSYCQFCQSLITNEFSIKFCDRSCAAKYNNALKTVSSSQKETTANSLSKYHREKYEANPKICGQCGEIKTYEKRNLVCCKKLRELNPNPTQKAKLLREKTNIRNVIFGPWATKCKSCDTFFAAKGYKLYCGSCKSNTRHYRSLASFDFNVYECPEEFDLKLISELGWFSPNGYKKRNKKVNMNGVSRDHMYSISEGFATQRDPKKLSHPANCQIIKHNGPGGNNERKSSLITWEELLVRIDAWETKYGESPQS